MRVLSSWRKLLHQVVYEISVQQSWQVSFISATALDVSKPPPHTPTNTSMVLSLFMPAVAAQKFIEGEKGRVTFFLAVRSNYIMMFEKTGTMFPFLLSVRGVKQMWYALYSTCVEVVLTSRHHCFLFSLQSVQENTRGKRLPMDIFSGNDPRHNFCKIKSRSESKSGNG